MFVTKKKYRKLQKENEVAKKLIKVLLLNSQCIEKEYEEEKERAEILSRENIALKSILKDVSDSKNAILGVLKNKRREEKE